MVMQCEGEVLVRIPGKIDRARAAALQEAVGVRTSGLDQSRIAEIGTFSVGTDLRRSDALALVQLIILNRLACARAAGGAYAESPDHSRRAPIGSELALPV
jgi:hypothetical protein